jgi:copper chaperone
MQLFNVTGMTCDHCVRAVTSAILGRDATAAVRVDLDSGRVEVESKLPYTDLAEAILEEGYGVS